MLGSLPSALARSFFCGQYQANRTAETNQENSRYPVSFSRRHQFPRGGMNRHMDIFNCKRFPSRSP